MTHVFIHESSYIDAEVEIGAGSKVWHFTHILGHTQVGESCIIGQNCSLGPQVRIGNKVKIQNNVSVYKGVTIEDEVFVGPSVVFTNVINPRAFLEKKDEFRPTVVQRGASIGANATILCGVNIGSYAMVGAGSVLTKSIPDFALVVGVPAKQIGWVGVSGNTLTFDDRGLATDQDGKMYLHKDDKGEQIFGEEHAIY